MNQPSKAISELYRHLADGDQVLHDPQVAHLIINQNEVLGLQGVPGLEVQAQPQPDGVDVTVHVAPGTVLAKPVHMCFGVLPERGLQQIRMEVSVGAGAHMAILAHCVFPNAVAVQHRMDARITVGVGAVYRYFERHVHGAGGGIQVVPKAKITLAERARFKTEFELLQGRVGMIDIDYETHCGPESVLEMMARINGVEDDIIKIHETGHLEGEGATGVLTTKLAVRGHARAEVHNRLTASAPHARGHVDCKEVVQDHAVAMAVPIVEVSHPQAHVTHEAAIGSVDTKQLETLMARGLDEEAAVDLIIQGLLS